MYVLIANADPLGRQLAEVLVNRGHEVAYVDEEAEFCNLIATQLGCLVIQGDTANINVLMEAGIERASVVVTPAPVRAGLAPAPASTRPPPRCRGRSRAGEEPRAAAGNKVHSRTRSALRQHLSPPFQLK